MKKDPVSRVRKYRSSAYLAALTEPLVYGKYYGEKSFNFEFTPIVTKKSHSILSKNTLSNNIIPMRSVNEAIKNICDYSLDVSPDFIIGLNRGGTMVAALIALILGLPSKSFSRCYVGNGEIECSDITLSGKVLIIDDISRSGETMYEARKFISGNYPDALTITTASLFSYVDKNLNPSFWGLDYYSTAVSSKDIKLPWNEDPASRKEQFEKVKNERLESLAYKFRHTGTELEENNNR